jgi:hypothetical protein
MHVRRSLLAGLALATLLVSSAAEAQTRRTRPRTATTSRTVATLPAPSLSVGGLVGLEFANGETGFSLRADGEWPFSMLTPKLVLSGVGSLGWTNFGESAGGVDVSTNIFKLVPAARLTFPVAPQLDVYGDAGLGLYLARSSIDFPGSIPDSSDSGFGVTLRFAAGGFYEAAPRLRIGAELGVNPFFGDLSDTLISLMVGVMYRL